eukprot:3009042-Lingulodinium_polyedra.AAC.1
MGLARHAAVTASQTYKTYKRAISSRRHWRCASQTAPHTRRVRWPLPPPASRDVATPPRRA